MQKMAKSAVLQLQHANETRNSTRGSSRAVYGRAGVALEPETGVWHYASTL